MAYYMEKAKELKKLVDAFIIEHCSHRNIPESSVQLGHIVNLAVRCNPRQPQGTVRKNIVAKAVESHCQVTMTKEVDERTQREYNKIHIVEKE